MNQDNLKRVKEAYKYQKLAFRALLPESMAGHMDVIEKELKAMLIEGAGCVLEKGRSENHNNRYSSKGWSTDGKNEEQSQSQYDKQEQSYYVKQEQHWNDNRSCQVKSGREEMNYTDYSGKQKADSNISRIKKVPIG